MPSVNFSQKPEKLTEYAIRQPVTRENFLSFFMTSFMVSKGVPEIQRMFFLLAEKTVGFELAPTMESLATNGGFDGAFTREEQFIFKSAFDRISEHKKKLHASIIGEEMRDEIVRWHEDPSYQKIRESLLPQFNFEAIKTIAQFTEAAAPFIKEWKEANKDK